MWLLGLIIFGFVALLVIFGVLHITIKSEVNDSKDGKKNKGIGAGITLILAIFSGLGGLVVFVGSASITATTAPELILTDEIELSSQLPDLFFVDVFYTVNNSAYANGVEYLNPIVVGDVYEGKSEIVVSFYHRFFWFFNGPTFEKNYTIRKQSIQWVNEYPDFDSELNQVNVRFDKHEIGRKLSGHDILTDGVSKPIDSTMMKFNLGEDATIRFFESNGQPFRKVFIEDVENVGCVVVSYNDESYEFNVKKQPNIKNNVLEIDLDTSGKITTDSIEIQLIPFDENKEIKVNNILFDRYISRYY